MKKKIHPAYYEDAKIVCACGNKFVVGSTQKEVHTEICSACHPFYTGKQKLLDTAGRLDKFKKRLEKKTTLSKVKVGRKAKRIRQAKTNSEKQAQ